MKTLSALGSTALLTAVSLFSQVVGFLYRVALSRMVGAEIMGLYQLVMPVSSVLLSLTAVGFTVACSHLSARDQAVGNKFTAARTVHACVAGFLTAFTAVALVVAPLSAALSVHFLGDARARLGILLLLPWVLLTGLENIHKHFFYGSGNVRPPAFTEICEQVIRAGAVLGLLWYFLPQNPERTVGLIVCGMIVCEVFSAATLTLLYRKAMRRPSSIPSPSSEGRTARKALRRRVLSIALPIGATALLSNLMGAWTAVLVPQRLVRTGSDVSSAMSAFGVMCGMTLPLLSLPTAFISAMGLVLLPKLSQAAALGRMELCRVRADKAITAAAWLILPASALLSVLAHPLGAAMFHNAAVGEFALPLALGVAMSCFEAVTSVCLNGLGKQRLNAAHGLVCGAVQLFLTWWRMALPDVGLRGYVEAFLVSTVVGCTLNWRTLHTLTKFPFLWRRWLIAPGLSALLAALDAKLLFPVLTRSGLGETAAALGCLGLGIVVYLSAMAAQGMLDSPLSKGKGSLGRGSKI